MNKTNKYYVYIYLDPRIKGKFVYEDYCFINEPIYVGKGTGGRLFDHLTEKFEKSDNKKKIKKINSILKSNKTPIIIKIKDKMEEKNAFDLEIKLIKSIGRVIINNGPLTNIQGGGGGFNNWIPTENWIKNNKEGQQKRWAKPGSRERHSKVLKEVGKRESFKKNMSKSMKKEWADPIKREKRIQIQQRDDIRKKKSEASIKAHSKTWILIDPNGKRYISNRLNEFCKGKNLSSEMLQQVALARMLDHRDWLCFKIGEEESTLKKLKQLKIDKEVIERNRREKLKIASTGRQKTEEEKRKIGLAAKGNKHGVGYKHSESNKEKIRQASKQRWENPEFREKMKRNSSRKKKKEK